MSLQFDILIVEDEPVVIDAAKKILIPEGFKVDEAYNAESALRKLQQHTYKVVLTDLMLPNMTGFELIEEVKGAQTQIPVIAITGYATLENAMRSFKVGGFDFIPKPFDIEELLGVVYRGLNFFKAQQNHVEHFPGNEYVDGKYYFLGDHSSAKLNADGSVTIAVGKTFPNLTGDIQEIELPILETEILQGNTCARIASNKNLIHRVWSPLSGRVVEVNVQLGKDVNLINTHPLDDGWLIRMAPTNLQNELENLTVISEKTVK
jgi:DNA-binding response OmpR family regulator